jgi:RNA polymerase sigma factor (sigma-70 family)
MISPSKVLTKQGDSELLAGVAAGDRRALEELYFGYHRRLARFLSRFTPRYENIEEIINDTFMAVWRSAKDFRSASQVSTWIFGIAYRTALKSLRRQKHHTAAANLDDHPEQTVDPRADAELQDDGGNRSDYRRPGRNCEGAHVPGTQETARAIADPRRCDRRIAGDK